ncbi:MAG TPA: glucose 1-dehydrogenase [Candidatus Thermoplasmatota archaeon]|nr:glucose 1-dehydrogenase [Candidatus Thermoplasmatota archaeon]
MNVSDLFNLRTKTAVVTGASRGLGQAMAVGLAKAGATVVAADLLDVSVTVDDIMRLGRDSLGVTLDVTKSTDIKKMVQQAVKKFGRIDILVNNAGIVRQAPAESMTQKDWNDVINVNLNGEFLCAQEVGKQMIKQQAGRIINIASVAGLYGSAGSAAYSASKAGIILFTKALALEWAKHNINVNAICPGVFVTAMTDSYLKDPGFQQTIKTRVPLARPGVPEELVGTVIYLSSRASEYMTGHALVVDGGWTAGL